LFSVLQVLRAIGGVLLICLTSGLAGALLGFLFGLPRPMTAAEAPPAAAAPANVSPPEEPAPPAAPAQPDTDTAADGQTRRAGWWSRRFGSGE